MSQFENSGTCLDSNLEWVAVCPASEIELEDVRRFDYGRATYAVYRTRDGYYASDGLCTHEKAQLAGGLVLDDIIECPLHNGRFHIPTRKALTPPVCLNLKTYPGGIEQGILNAGLAQTAGSC